MPTTTWQTADSVVAREEGPVEDIAMWRLIPVAELVQWLERRSTTGGVIEVHQVAEEFDVPEVVAECALRLLLTGRGSVEGIG